MASAPIRFRGGRSARYDARGDTPTGRAHYAPRWSPGAAAAALVAVRRCAVQAGMVQGGAASCTIFLSRALACDDLWGKVTRAVHQEASRDLADCAMAVLDFHRTSASAMGDAERSHLANSISRAMRRRAGECAPMESLGVFPIPVQWPASFHGWIDDVDPDGPVRPNPPVSSGEGPLARSAQWRLDRVAHDGVVVFGRAGARVREWCRRRGGGAPAVPPIHLAETLVHRRVLPTAVSSRNDHWWLTRQQRYMSVVEVCRAMGLDDASPLALALRDTRVVGPTTAVALAGKGIHASVATIIVAWLDARGLLPTQLTYASACSGVDFFAEAVRCARPHGFSYAYASEPDSAARAVLRVAWGLDGERIYMDAGSAEALSERVVDLLVISPECNKFSRRRHGRDAALTAAGAVDAEHVLQPVRRQLARVVVVENVDEADGVAAITTVLQRAGAYMWFTQALDPQVHAACPVARARRYWVGIQH